jgi:peroxiredoxin
MCVMRTYLILIACLLSPLLNAEIPSKAKDTQPLETGVRIPSVELQTVDGQTVNLAAQVFRKPSIIVFYRGSWCPYCNEHLASLVDIEDDLEKLGYQVVAISPDKPANLKEAIEKNDLNYLLLSDSSAEAAKAFGLAFTVNAATRLLYKGYGIDLEEASGQDHHILPVPAVYLVDKNGILQFRYTNPDYKVRLSADELLEAAKSHAKEDK